MKQAILVVGTGRSGTSAMTGVLQLLGAQLGEGTDLKIGDAHNAKGYFENTRITALNKAVLADAGISWYESPPDRVHAIPPTTLTVSAVSDRIDTAFEMRSPIAIKDPRLCVLLDVYVAALHELGYDTTCLRMRRPAIEVARSLMSAMDGTTEEHWLPMIAHHAELLEAAIQRTGVPCIDIDFDDLVMQPARAVQAVLDRCAWLTECANDDLATFVDRSLKHHG